MIAIVFATLKEAAPFIAAVGARRAPTDLPVDALYTCDAPRRVEPHAHHPKTQPGTGRDGGPSPSALIVVTGMGRDKAAVAIHALLEAHDIELVINAGLCGALTRTLSTGDLRTVDRVFDGDAASGPVTLSPCPGLAAATLATVSEPLHGGAQREALASRADVVDMEGFEIARASTAHGVPCMMIKGVSDRACEKASSDIAANIAAVSEKLADALTLQTQSGAPLPPRAPLRRVAGERGQSGSAGASPSSSITPSIPNPQSPPPDAGVLRNLHRFTRVEHTLFSLPLIFAGAWIGAGHAFFGWRIAALVALVGVGGRMMGMALNRLFDRKLDALNPRTANRDLPAGRLSVAAGYGVAAAGLLAYLAGCAALGPLCLALSPVPLIPLILYSLLKRFTSLCHYGIGICLGMAPLGAYIAAAGVLPLEPEILLLAGFTFFWISGFDIIYALQDMESDRQNGVRSIPASLGRATAQIVAACTHAVSWGLLAALWQVQGGGLLPGLALLVALGAFVAAYVPAVPLPVRFFPVSAIAGIAGALVVLLT